MNTKSMLHPFESAKIEVVILEHNDIIVTSIDPFPGEDDNFDT